MRKKEILFCPIDESLEIECPIADFCYNSSRLGLRQISEIDMQYEILPRIFTVQGYVEWRNAQERLQYLGYTCLVNDEH